jgi:hypothetical protein
MEEADWRQRAQRRCERAQSNADQGDGEKDLDEEGQGGWRVHGSEKGAGEEKVQGRPQGALMGKLFLLGLAIGIASLIGLAIFVIQL